MAAGSGSRDGYRTSLSEVQAVLLAASAWVGALLGARFGFPIPVAGALVVVGVGLIARSRPALILGVAILALAAGDRADDAYQPVAPRPYRGAVTAVSDPRRFGVGWRIEVALPDGRRVDATGYGIVAGTLASASAGDRIVLDGELRAMADTPWARSRHLVGRLTVDDVVSIDGPRGLRGLVERIRDAVASGAQRLAPDHEALYLGLVIGDDRDQSPAQRARFRAAGLTHLLAVSGQNVAFVLTVARPLVQVTPRRARFAATVAILVVFATVTRFEPSVLRATATAGLAAWASLGGHPQSAVRLLALATTGLVLIDPFLVHAVGFQLSIGASAGIVVLGPLIIDRIRGPGAIVEPVAVTVAAQLGVVPLLFLYFGPVSLASIPANVAAGWAAGMVMMLGLTVGVVGGLDPLGLGHVVQAPSGALVWWLDEVAAWAARLPLPRLGPRLATVGAGLGLARWLIVDARRRRDRGTASPPTGNRRDRRDRGAGTQRPRPTGGTDMAIPTPAEPRDPIRPRRPVAPPRAQRMLSWSRVGLATAATTALVTVSVLAVPEPPARPTELTGGGRWFPAAGEQPSVLVIGTGADERLLDELLAHRIRSVDVVLSEAGSGRAGRVAHAVTELVTTGVLLAPPQHRIVGATRIRQPTVVVTGGARLTVEVAPTRLTVTVTVGE